MEKKGRLPAILSSLMQSLDGKVWIQDRNGNLLLGSDPAPQGRSYPILLNGVEIGCTLGGRAAASLGELLSYLLQEETEKKSLAAEVLERYRELSLLHNLSNKLAAAPQPEAIPQVSLDEITRLIHATAGVIILRSSKADDGYLPVASTGANQLAPCDWAPGSLVERVLLSGKGDISNPGPAGETSGSAAGASRPPLLKLKCAGTL